MNTQGQMPTGGAPGFETAGTAPDPHTLAPLPPFACQKIPASLRLEIKESPDALGLVGEDGRIVCLSPGFLEQAGFDASDDLTGLHLSHLWRHDTRTEVAAAMARTLRGRKGTIEMDLCWMRNEGGECTVTLSPVQRTEGVIRMRIDCD